MSRDRGKRGRGEKEQRRKEAEDRTPLLLFSSSPLLLCSARTAISIGQHRGRW
jgi:hypothetical protein